MIGKYKYFDFVFDRKLFAEDLKRFTYRSSLRIREINELIGVSNFMTYMYPDNSALPSMRDYIILCNLMDEDPKKYFVMVSPSK